METLCPETISFAKVEIGKALHSKGKAKNGAAGQWLREEPHRAAKAMHGGAARGKDLLREGTEWHGLAKVEQSIAPERDGKVLSGVEPPSKGIDRRGIDRPSKGEAGQRVDQPREGKARFDG